MQWKQMLLAVSVLACAKEGGGDAGAALGKGGAGGKGGPPAFPVEVEPVRSESVEYVVSAVGSVEAFEIVTVTARVAGVVEEVRFREGQQVKAGETLVEIDPGRYALAVSAASATQEKSEVALSDAEAGLSRRESASQSSPGLIPEEELESWRTKARGAKAEVQSSKVALSQAQLNLRDARVKAPIAGTIETRSVSTGEYVQPGTVLATLLQRDPLLLRFKVSETEAARLAPQMPLRFTVRGDTTTRGAVITAVAGAADPVSRLVNVTAEVDAKDRDTLRPGAFAEVNISVGAQEAPVIPETAVRPSGKGFLAFVVADGVAHERVLRLGMRTADGRVEVMEGLSTGETLVVRGAEALREGAKVRASGAKEKGGAAKGSAQSQPASQGVSSPTSQPTPRGAP
jgi:multidrug efflux system membrane fusion protein